MLIIQYIQTGNKDLTLFLDKEVLMAANTWRICHSAVTAGEYT